MYTSGFLVFCDFLCLQSLYLTQFLAVPLLFPSTLYSLDEIIGGAYLLGVFLGAT